MRGCGDPAPHRCQVAVSLSVANAVASLPVAWQLYRPREWAEDSERRSKTGVPEAVAFKTKPAIALDQIEKALGIRSRRLWLPVSRKAWCWLMPAMARI